jgi:predicted amidophosphoribosyltransferase
MRLGKKILKRPRCESCGERIYRSTSPFRNYFWGDTPSHCSRCGKKFNSDTQKHLNAHDEFVWLSWCGVFIIFVIVVVVILL